MKWLVNEQGIVDRSRQKEELVENVSCELCGESFTVPWRIVKAHYSQDFFTIVKCNQCGLVFVNPRLSGEFREFCYRNEKHLVSGFYGASR